MDSPQAIAFSFFSLALGIVSLCFWVQLIREAPWGLPLLPRRFADRPVRTPRLAVVLMLAALIVFALGPLLSGGDPLTLEQVRKSLFVSLILDIAIIVVLFLAIVLGVRRPTELIRLGFRTDGLPQQIWDGVRGFLIALLPVLLILILSAPLRSEDALHPYLQLILDSGLDGHFALIAVLSVFTAPLKEELMFRVILQSWLKEWFSPSVAIVATAILFALVHNFPDSLGIFALALVLGIVFERRCSYVAVVVLHGLFNAYNVLATTMTLFS